MYPLSKIIEINKNKNKNKNGCVTIGKIRIKYSNLLGTGEVYPHQVLGLNRISNQKACKKSKKGLVVRVW